MKYLVPLFLLAIGSIACDGGGLDERSGRFAAYESGYEAGYEDGFNDGYGAGLDPCGYWQEQRQAALTSRESLEELIARAELPPVIAGQLIDEATARLEEANRAVDEHC